MRPLLLTTRRVIVSGKWVCSSCRNKSSSRVCPISTASQALRANGPARTRFAPSPTGYLHLGSLRTALFNYLVSKATGGQFLLRIEDTDQKRTIPGAERKLYEDLEWAGIEWDEGPKKGGPYGPYKQSERTALYREHAEYLLESGNAYRCFCTAERLNELAKFRAQVVGMPPDYDRKCAHIAKEESDDRASKGEANVIRLKVPDRYPIFNDLVYGVVRQRPLASGKSMPSTAIDSFDDPILLKSDGFPTYHLANVVDDHLMKISHVIRGSEWVSSTPKHLAIYQAFGWKPPAFAHVGLLKGEDGQKLSKRTGSIDIESYRKRGIFPEALTNFVALLGWSHEQRLDMMSMEQLIENASLKYTRGDTIVGFTKLDFLQRRHAARYASLPSGSTADPDPTRNLLHLAVKPMCALLEERLKSKESLPVYSAVPEYNRERYVNSILQIDAANYVSPERFLDRNKYFFIRPSHEDRQGSPPKLKLHDIPTWIPYTPFSATLFLFRSLIDLEPSEWKYEAIKERISWIIEQGKTMSLVAAKKTLHNEEHEKLLTKAWAKMVHAFIRSAVMAGAQGPDGAKTMVILGRKETVRRLEEAEKIVNESEENAKGEEK